VEKPCKLRGNDAASELDGIGKERPIEEHTNMRESAIQLKKKHVNKYLGESGARSRGTDTET
jgi:hypothetical protein